MDGMTCIIGCLVNLTLAKLHGKVEKPVDESEKLKFRVPFAIQSIAGNLYTLVNKLPLNSR
jgi:hypothetical protein